MQFPLPTLSPSKAIPTTPTVRRLLSVCGAVLLLGGANAAHAANINWIGAAGGNWNTAGNWAGSNIPNASGETAYFAAADASGSPVTFSAAVGGAGGFAGILVDRTTVLAIQNTANSVVNFRIGDATGITINSGAGPFTLEATGGASSGIQLIVNTTATYTFANHSSNTATLALGAAATSQIIPGGGSSPTLLFTGAGNWDVQSKIVNGSGVVALTKSGTGTVILSGANTYSGLTTISGGTLQIGNGGTDGTLGSGAVVNDANLTFNRSDNFTVNNAISGTGTLTKNGAGELTLGVANSYSGGTTINNGVIVAINNNSLGDNAGSVAITSNGALRVNSTSGQRTIAQALTGGGTVEFTGNSSNRGLVTGDLSGFTGDFHILNTGVFAAWNATATAAIATNSQAITIDTGGTLQVLALGAVGSPAVVSFGALNGSGAVGTNGPGSVQYGTLSIGNGGGSGTFSGAINEVGGNARLNLVKNGGGTQILSGTNAYAGTTTINAGVLQIGAGGASGTLGDGAVVNDASLVFNRSDNLTVNNAISGTGTLTKNGAGELTLGGTNSYTGATTINLGTLVAANNNSLGANSSSVAVANNAALRVNSASSQRTIAQTITGGGTIEFTGNSSNRGLVTGNLGGFTGDFHVLNTGVFAAWNAAATAPIATSTQRLTIDAGGSVQVLAGAGTPTTSFGALFGAGSINTNGGTSNSAILSLGNGGASGNFSGTIADTNLTSGTLRLVKNGSGTQILSGANTYRGTTTVNDGVLTIAGTHSGNGAMTVNNGGTLLINGAKSGTGAITVASGGTLGGLGTIAGAATIQGGGTLSPGTSPGTITFTNDLTLQTNAIVEFEAGDLIVVNNLLTLPADWVLALSSESNWAYNAAYWTVVFDYGSASLASGWDDWSNILFPAVDFDTSLVTLVNDTASGQIRLMGLYAVPEPSSWLLGATGLAMCGAVLRRKAAARRGVLSQKKIS